MGRRTLRFEPLEQRTMLDIGAASQAPLEAMHVAAASESPAVAASAPSAATAAEGAKPAFVPGEVLLGLRTEARAYDFRSVATAVQWPESLRSVKAEALHMVYSLPSGDGFLTVVKVPLPGEVGVLDAVAQLQKSPGVEFVEPNYYIYGGPDAEPDDPDFHHLNAYHHELLDTPAAWDAFQPSGWGGSGIIVAVIDDGVDFTHEDLGGALAPSSKVWSNTAEINGEALRDDDQNGYVDDFYGWDFVDGDGYPLPDGESHGTHVAGILGATTDNTLGIAGVAGDVQIMALRLSDAYPPTVADEGAAIAYAVNKGAHIISRSRTMREEGFYTTDTFVGALDSAYSQGVLFVNSSGNDHAPNPEGQNFAQVLFVAATNQNDAKAGDSNYGTGIDISAPGVEIWSTIPGVPPNNYATMSGTSMSTPMVAGVAALIWSKNGWPRDATSRDKVVAQLLGTAKNIDAENHEYLSEDSMKWMLGAGRVDANRAVNDDKPPPPRIGGIIDVPDGLPEFTEKITAHLQGVFTAASVEATDGSNHLLNWTLTYAGANDEEFDDGDDVNIPLKLDLSQYLDYTRERPPDFSLHYRVGMNDIAFTFDKPTWGNQLQTGIYRFKALSGSSGLKDPFNQQLDGNADGDEGGNYTRDFYVGEPQAYTYNIPSGANHTLTLAEDSARPEYLNITLDNNPPQPVLLMRYNALRINGSNGADTITLSYLPHGEELRGPITIDGGGGEDYVTLHGSAWNDHLQRSEAGVTELDVDLYNGTTYVVQTQNAKTVTVEGHEGSNDASLTANNDNSDTTFSADPASAVMHDGTPTTPYTYRIEAHGFQKVDAYALVNDDTATLTGSDLDDTFTADVGVGLTSGDVYDFQVSNFRTVRATAGAGGTDTATMVGTNANDTFSVNPANQWPAELNWWNDFGKWT